MAEQKQEKEKHGLVKRIFKWIGLSILVLLILLALVIESPKILVIMLLIILAAFTVLPKPARKWFWLSVGAVVLLLIIWILLPENNEGWQPYQYNFDKELKELETKYSIPPEENTAILYNQLMESMMPTIIIFSTSSISTPIHLTKFFEIHGEVKIILKLPTGLSISRVQSKH